MRWHSLHTFFLVALLLWTMPLVVSAQDIPFTFVTYNCENLFDCRHDSLKDDREFLPEGSHAWTFPRYWRKLNDVGRVIQQCGGKGNTWRLPDVVAIVEVENDSVLFMLTRRSMLSSMGYRYIITNSADERGVDVAFLYNPYTFRLIEHHPIRVPRKKQQRPTRDILYAKGMIASGDTIHLFAVHAPSRSGGEVPTEPYRMAVAQRLMTAVDSIRASIPQAHIIIGGDFNDYSYNNSLQYISSCHMEEVSKDATGINNPKKVRGTYKYKGQWESLDHVFLSPSLIQKVRKCYILDAPWLLQKDSQGGSKPRRTYLGPYYNGGVSDHLPIVLNISF